MLSGLIVGILVRFLMEHFNYFNVGVMVFILLDKEAGKSFNFPINVVLELKESESFDLEYMKKAKTKAISQLAELFEQTKMEDYIEKADLVFPSVFSISFLGTNTHEGFLGKEPTGSLAEKSES